MMRAETREHVDYNGSDYDGYEEDEDYEKGDDGWWPRKSGQLGPGLLDLGPNLPGTTWCWLGVTQLFPQPREHRPRRQHSPFARAQNLSQIPPWSAHCIKSYQIISNHIKSYHIVTYMITSCHETLLIPRLWIRSPPATLRQEKSSGKASEIKT